MQLLTKAPLPLPTPIATYVTCYKCRRTIKLPDKRGRYVDAYVGKIVYCDTWCYYELARP